MQRWEYCSIGGSEIFYYRTRQKVEFRGRYPSKYETRDDFESKNVYWAVTQLGIEGWELVTVTDNHVYYFKRPLEE
jgi:hypothetical protein